MKPFGPLVTSLRFATPRRISAPTAALLIGPSLVALSGCQPEAVAPVPVPDDWVQRAQVLSCWPLPEEQRSHFGVDVNGVWVGRSAEELAAEAAMGRPALVSIQGLAAEAELLREYPELSETISLDVFGQPSRVPWYDWLDEPVSTLSITHPAFQDYLWERGRQAIADGAHGLFVDEIQTSALLVSLEPYGAGFAPWEVEAFLASVDQPSFAAYAAERWGLTTTLDLPAFLRDEAADAAVARAELFASYRAFAEEDAFAAMSSVIARIRSHAADEGKSIAIGANLAGLGALTEWSPLTAPIWQDSMDFVVFEHDPPTLQAAIAPYYQLGRATLNGMVAAMPGLTLSDTLNDMGGAGWLHMAYAEAFAFEGNWAVSYWAEEMGWEADALLPEDLRPSMEFVAAHRDLFEGSRAPQSVALVYPNALILADPAVHEAWVETAEALLAAHIPFDVAYSGDARFHAYEPDLSGYATVLQPGDAVPDVGGAALEAPGRVFATSYDREGRSGPVVHLVNRDYDEGSNSVRPKADVAVSIPLPNGWGAAGDAVLMAPGTGDVTVRWRGEGGRLRFTVPALQTWVAVDVQSS